MSIDKKEMQAYYRDIRKALPCSLRHKKRMITDLQNSVNSYLAENPDASFAEIQTHFGTPRAIADSYAEQLDAGEVIKKLDVKKTIVLAVCGALLLAIVFWAAAVAVALIDGHDSNTGYGKYEPVIEFETEETQ